jgi:hypothetical protein
VGAFASYHNLRRSETELGCSTFLRSASLGYERVNPPIDNTMVNPISHLGERRFKDGTDEYPRMKLTITKADGCQNSDEEDSHLGVVLGW